MRILDGRVVAQKMREDLKAQTARFVEQYKKAPCLRVVLVGNDPASEVYVRQKIKSAREVGMDSEALRLPKDISLADIKQKIQSLNKDPAVHAVLVQLPLPADLPWKEIVACLDPLKDVDGLTAENQGRAWLGQARIWPCTPAGIIRLLEHYEVVVEGKSAVVVGRSWIVGLPMAQLLLQANATVTICHSRTKELSAFTRQADIVVVSAGREGLLGRADFKEGAVVVDVGIHRATVEGRTVLRGDVRFEELKGWAGGATPVPGGVGPMTVAMLLHNTFKLARLAEEEAVGAGSGGASLDNSGRD